MSFPERSTIPFAILLAFSWLATSFAPAGDEKKAGSTPVPTESRIESTLRLLPRLAGSNPPDVSEVNLSKDKVLVTRQVIEHVPFESRRTVPVIEDVYETEQYKVKVGDKIETRTRKVLKQVIRQVEHPVIIQKEVFRPVQQAVAADSVRAFVVTKDGKLEPLASAKFLGMLTKPMHVLIGTADVDPRRLELIRPGAIYLVIDDVASPGPPRKAPPDSKEG